MVDWFSASSPVDGDDATWVAMERQVQGPVFSVDQGTYIAPRSGALRFGTFDERDPRLDPKPTGDLNRDGNPAGSSGDEPPWDR